MAPLIIGFTISLVLLCLIGLALFILDKVLD